MLFKGGKPHEYIIRSKGEKMHALHLFTDWVWACCCSNRPAYI